MQDIQEIFSKIQEAKEEQKDIRKEYRDALKQESSYEEVTEQLKQLRDKKKLIEEEVKGQLGSRWEQLEDLKNNVENWQQMLTDIAMTSLMKGESIAVKDGYDNLYEPRFSITFKRADGAKETSE